MNAIQPPSAQEAKNVSDWLKLIMPLLGSFLFGNITGWFAHIWAARRDRQKRTRDAKDAFVKLLSEKLAAIPDEGAKTYCLGIKPDIKTGVYVLLPFLSEKERASLRLRWEAFDAIDAEKLGDAEEEGEALRNFASVAETGGPAPETAQRIMKRHLESLIAVFSK